jgi:TP901 family phage tail tape measure protein
MAEEIKQVLGFDAGQAIAEINKFDSKLKQLQGSLKRLATGLNTFNRQAARSVAILQRLADQAARLRRELGAGFATVKSATPIEGGGQQQIRGIIALGNNAKETEKRIKAVGQAGQKMGQAVSNGARQGQAAAQGLSVSFETMARIITTQLIVRALGSLQQALAESVRAAAEFQLQVAEIATIDPRGAAFGEISQEVLALSNAFNADLGDVGKGLYQTISNQIATVGTESERASKNYEFLSTAIQLSRAGVATVEQSVNLLAGTLNAFGQSTDDAARIAGQFFQVVELGRTTIRELATSFNTVAPLAAELGVSIEELGAAFATITIGGVDTAKAATQIRGAMNALLKPTTEMKQAFEALGVSTGEDLIELFGFQGALQAVIGTTDGTSQSIAKLIPRVRGLTGVLRLVGSGAKTFQDDLQKIIETNRELLDEKFDIVASTNAFEVEQELRKLRNFLIDDFGNSVIRITKGVLDFAGGMENVIQVLSAVGKGVQQLGPELAVVGAAIAAVGIQAKIASVQVGVLGKTFAILAGIALAISAGEFIGTQIKELITANIEARKLATEVSLADISKRAQAERDVESATNKQILAGVQARFAAISELNAKRIREARTAAQEELAANKSAFEALIGASETLEKALRSQYESREQQAKDSIDKVKSLESSLRDERFDQRTKDFNESKKFAALERKLAEDRAIALSQVNRQALNAGEPEALETIRQAYADAETAARELQEAAGADPRRQQRANQAVLQAIQTRIGLEKQLQRIIAARREAEKRAADEVAERNRKLKETFKELIDAQEGLFETGISDDERNRRFKQFSDSRLKFFDQIQKNSEVGAKELADFSRVFGDRGFKGIVERELSRFEIKQLVVSQSALLKAQQDINTALQGGVDAIDVEIRLSLEAAGINVTSQAQALESIKDAVNADELIKATESEIREIEARAKQIISTLPNIKEEIAKRIGPREETFESIEAIGGKPVTAEPARALGALQVALVQAIEDGKVAKEEITQVGEALTKAQTAFKSFQGLGGQKRLEIGLSADLQQVGELVRIFGLLRVESEKLAEAQKKLKEAQEGSLSDPTQRANIIKAAEVAGERQKAAAAAAEAEAKTKGTGDAATQATTQLDGMTTSVKNTRDQVAALQSDLNNLQAPDVSPVAAAKGGLIQQFAKGGLVKYLDRGGFLPRGTDTIPAMLSPGEFVVNARSARRFYSELSAINAGVRPIYRQEGGPVNNMQIGDINVAVQPGRSNETTGREIGRSLRRELRRGSSTL